MRTLRLLLITLVVMSMVIPLNTTSITASSQTFQEGDIFVGVQSASGGSGTIEQRRSNATLVGEPGGADPSFTGDPAGMAFDRSGNLYVAASGSRYIFKFDRDGSIVKSVRTTGSPFSVAFDASDHLYVGHAVGGGLEKYDTQLNLIATSTLAVPSKNGSPAAIYQLDVSANQCTLLYTIGDATIRRFDVCTNQQLPDLGTLPDSVTGVRILFDGTALAATSTAIHRLDAHANTIQLYSAAGAGAWHGLALSPDGASFWAGRSSTVYKFSVKTGQQLASFNTSDQKWVQSIAIFSQICGSSQDCDLDGLSNLDETTITHTNPYNKDTDGDGLLDPWEIDPDPDGDGTPIAGAGFNLDADPHIEVTRDAVFGPYSDDQDAGGVGSYADGRFPQQFPSFVQPPNPLRKDIYFELDWQDCSFGADCPEYGAGFDPTHHAPSALGIDKVRATFARAPVNNADGSSGINLHVLIDESLGHEPNCDRGLSALRRAHFGTPGQRMQDQAVGGILEAKTRTFRYIWSGHSTERETGGECTSPASIFNPGAALPFYDYTPFGDALVGGSDILISLSPLWACRSYSAVYGVTSCYKKDGPASATGIFPGKVSTANGSGARLFNWPLHAIIMRNNAGSDPEGAAIAQIWGRTLMHLIGHSLGIVGQSEVLNDPRVYGTNGVLLGAEPELYASWAWAGIRYAPGPADGGATTEREAYPHQEVSPRVDPAYPYPFPPTSAPQPFYSKLDIDGDGVRDGIDNCLMGIKNPNQADLDRDYLGDACDYDIDGDGQLNAVGSNTPTNLDAFPYDTNNDGEDNAVSADDDGDTIFDNVDNCRLDANTSQLDTDQDSQGDACDEDDDNDAFVDKVEAHAGSNPLSNISLPEYVGRDASCADGLDNDGDDQIDGADAGCSDTDNDTLADADDNCPNLANQGWIDRDDDGIGDACDSTPLPPNTAPTVAIAGTYTVDEGSSVTVAAAGADAESSSLAFVWDLNNDGTFGSIGQSATLATGDLEIDGPGAHPIAVKAVDQGQLTATATTNVTVRNVAPVVGSITAAKNPVMATTLLMASANFSDAGVSDTHTAIWDWGDGTTTEAYIDEMRGAGTAKGSHIYTAPGSYTVKLTVKDDDQASAQVMLQNVVVQPAPIVEYSTAALTVHENISSVTATVLLRSPSTETVEVNYTTSNGSAMAGSDYYTASGTLTFAPGETAKTFTVQIENDPVDEANEVINLSLSDPLHATLGPSSTATITIQDDDVIPSVAFALAKITIHENVGLADVEVKLSSASNNPISVDYTTSNGTAIAGSDYTATSGTLTFDPGETRKSFSVPIADDGVAEPNETINLTLSNPINATPGTTTSSVLTISANDTISLGGNVSVPEYVGSAAVTVKLNAPSSKAVRVGYTTSGGTASAGSDYTATSGTLTFDPGQTTQTIAIPIVNDLVGEASETVILTLINPTNAEIGSPSSATVTISPNDIVSFVGNVSVHENADKATLTVRLNGPSDLPVSVDYATGDNTAKAGSDYAATSGTLTFDPGQTTKTFEVPILDDLLGEPNENFVVNLSNPTNAGFIATSIATVTINTNDRLSFGSNVSVHENTDAVTVTVKLNSPSNIPVTVDYATSDNTAKAGSDYTATSGTLVFDPGETTQTLSVPIIDDQLGELSEFFTVTLRNATNADISGPSPDAPVTINASDMVSFGGNVGVHENAGRATLTIKLNSPSNDPVTVSYTTKDVNAIAGSDYTATSGTFTFDPGELTKTFEVPILDDTRGELNETFMLELSNPINAGLGGPSEATVTINANDRVVFGGNVSVHENAGSATATVKLNGPSSSTVTVSYTTRDGTASAGSDYTATTGTVTFDPGQTTKTFEVPILDDLRGEGSEAFTLLLTTATNAEISGPSEATVTIGASDIVSFVGNVSVHENAGKATLTVRLNGPSSSTVTVDYATSDNTAKAGSDYTAISGTLTFDPGQTMKTFEVPILDDLLGEPNESFAVNLSNPTNAGFIATSIATVTINANDMVSFGASTYRVTENTALAAITVRLNGPASSTVSVNYSTSDGGAVAGGDYTATSGTLTFDPGQTTKTFEVSIADDTIDEANELVMIDLKSPVNAVLGPPSSTTLTIVDND
ncbi:MAG TPA: Calx-beta domain-containing protein [Herpetosiphonaceae bacterium]